MEIGLDVARDAGQLFLSGNATFRQFALLEDALSLLLVLPKIGLRGLLFEIG